MESSGPFWGEPITVKCPTCGADWLWVEYIHENDWIWIGDEPCRHRKAVAALVWEKAKER